MTKEHLGFLGILISLILGGQSFAQSLKLPFKDVGACPFECCTYREWTAIKETVVLKNMSDNSPALFKIKKGEKIEGVTGTVITTKAGIREALRNAYIYYYEENGKRESKVKVRKGEWLSVLTYLGEGVYKVWYKGKIYESHLDPPEFKNISQPKSVWWVKVKNRKNQIGWTRLTENFDNMDSCG